MMSKTKRASDDWLEIRIGGKRDAAFEEALLQKIARDLAKPDKPKTAKKKGGSK